MTEKTTGKSNPGASSADEWKELWRQVEHQVRRDAARVVGEPPEVSWSQIGRKAGESSREGAAKVVNAPKDADWETIGRQVEVNVRTGIATAVGATPNADWATVGQTVDQKVWAFLQSLFNQTKPAQSDAPAKPADLVDPWK